MIRFAIPGLALTLVACTAVSDYGKYTFGDAGVGDVGMDSAGDSAPPADADGGPDADVGPDADGAVVCDCDCGDACVAGECVPTDPAVAVSIGGRHACAVTASGALFCWGDNALGQLGVMDRTSRDAPALVTDLADVLTVSVGDEHTCATAGDFELWCWGSVGRGQLGLGSVPVTEYDVPQRVEPPTRFQQVSAGVEHTCAVRVDDRGSCWGRGTWGQLGIGTMGDSAAPRIFMEERENYSDISAGGQHTCGVRLGRGFCWGQGGDGRTGHDDTVNVSIPEPTVPPPFVWNTISAGGRHTCGIDDVGQLFCWGNGANGKLGLGGTTNFMSPTQVGVADSWTSVDAGMEHTCVVRGDDDMWCFGANDRGQLGLGDTTTRDTPTRVTNPMDGWSTVSAGASASCAVRTPGQVWCWGANTFGQLGLDDRTDREVPARVCLD